MLCAARIWRFAAGPAIFICFGAQSSLWLNIDAQVSEDSYEAMVAAPNINRQTDEPSARTVEDAISLLSTEDSTLNEDRHPERSVRFFTLLNAQ